MVKVYAKETKFNTPKNEKKAIRLVRGLWIFFCGMITLPFLLAITLYAVGVKEFNFVLFK
jgi:hypothetical protein